jgi:hypothetical protein
MNPFRSNFVDGNYRPLNFALRSGRKIVREARYAYRELLDRRRSTHLGDEEFMALAGLSLSENDSWLNLPTGLIESQSLESDNTSSEFNRPGFKIVADKSNRHVFSLLGSGDVAVSYDMTARGAFGHMYEHAPGLTAEATQRASMMVLLESAASLTGDTSASTIALCARIADSYSYRPIDWHRDIKSGYRWNPGVWWRRAKIGPAPGADIKVPWELSRSHHLVAMALDARNSERLEAMSVEISLQLIDWIAANPPRFGVNWRSTMEIAIRATNWIWAFSLIDADKNLPPAVRFLLAKSLYQHGQFITTHLDYVPSGTTNHYLADLAGLLQIASVFPSAPDSSRWIALCLQELHSEMDRTVLEDGGSYEGSTGYHRLVTEMFLHSTMAALRLSVGQRAGAAGTGQARFRNLTVNPSVWRFDPRRDEVFSGEYWRRLRAMVDVTANLTSPTGRVPQFGDQDDGRFLKLDWPLSDSGSSSTREEGRDHRHILALAGPLFQRGDWSQQGLGFPTDAAVGKGSRLANQSIPNRDGSEGSLEHDISPAATSPSIAGLGIYVLHDGDAWAAIRCRSHIQRAPTGHLHDDQLAIDLVYRGWDILSDVGTGVYTADLDRRNNFRSISRHNTASPIGEERYAHDTSPSALFTLKQTGETQGEMTNPNQFLGFHRRGRVLHERYVELTANELKITDRITGASAWQGSYVLAPGVGCEINHEDKSVTLNTPDFSVEVRFQPPPQSITATRIELALGYGTIVETTRFIIGVSHPGKYVTTFRFNP